MNTMRPGVYDAKELVKNLQSTFEKEIEELKEKNHDFKAYYYSNRAVESFGHDKAELLKSIVGFYDEMGHLATTTPKIVDEFKQILHHREVAWQTVHKSDKRYRIIDRLQEDLSFVSVEWQYKNFCQEAIKRLIEGNFTDTFPETMQLLRDGSNIELK